MYDKFLHLSVRRRFLDLASLHFGLDKLHERVFSTFVSKYLINFCYKDIVKLSEIIRITLHASTEVEKPLATYVISLWYWNLDNPCLR